MAAAEEMPNLSQSSTRSLSYIETPASQEHRRLSIFKLLKKYLQKASSGDPTPSVYRDEIIGQVHNATSVDPREKVLRAETIADPVLKSVREKALVGPTNEKSDTLCIILGTHGAYRSTEHNFSGSDLPFESASMCLGQPPGLSFVMSEVISNTMMEIICRWCQSGGSNTRQNQNFFSNSCNLCYNLSRADPVYSEAREAAVGKSRTKQSKCFKTRGFAKCLNEQEWMALVDDSKIMYAPINLKAGNIPDKLYTCLRDSMDLPTAGAPLWNNILFYDAESCLRSRPLLSLFEDEGSPYRGQYWNYIPWPTKSTIDPQLAELYSQLNKDVVSTPNVVFIAPNADAGARVEIVRKSRVLTAPLDGFYATITGYHPQPHSVIFLTVAPMEATSWPYANYKSSALINLPQLMAIAQDSPVNYGDWVWFIWLIRNMQLPLDNSLK